LGQTSFGSGAGFVASDIGGNKADVANAVALQTSGNIVLAGQTGTGAAEHAAARGIRLVHRPCEASHEAAAGAITRILQDRPGTTGLVVQNEAIISPLLSVLRTAGRTVPEDMSVVAMRQSHQGALQSRTVNNAKL